MKNTWKKLFDCGHTTTVGSADYHKIACPSCRSLANRLVLAGITEPHIIKALRDFSYHPASGRVKPLDKILAHIATLDTELLPKCALQQGREWDWARHMLAGTKPETYLSKAAAAAKLLRKELMEAFPGSTVRVTSQNYSGGNSIYANVSGLITEKQKNLANRIGNKYQEGHFDGMTDSYEYSNHDSSIPQAKYVFVSDLH